LRWVGGDNFHFCPANRTLEDVSDNSIVGNNNFLGIFSVTIWVWALYSFTHMLITNNDVLGYIANSIQNVGFENRHFDK